MVRIVPLDASVYESYNMIDGVETANREDAVHQREEPERRTREDEREREIIICMPLVLLVCNFIEGPIKSSNASS